jgi:hypothetical protein
MCGAAKRPINRLTIPRLINLQDEGTTIYTAVQIDNELDRRKQPGNDGSPAQPSTFIFRATQRPSFSISAIALTSSVAAARGPTNRKPLQSQCLAAARIVERRTHAFQVREGIDHPTDVQVLPPGGHFAVKQIDEMWDLHIGRLRLMSSEKFDAREHYGQPAL